MPEQVVVCPPIQLTLDCLHAIDMPLDRGGAPWLGEHPSDRSTVAINAVARDRKSLARAASNHTSKPVSWWSSTIVVKAFVKVTPGSGCKRSGQDVR